MRLNDQWRLILVLRILDFLHMPNLISEPWLAHAAKNLVVGQMQFCLDNYAYLARHLSKIRSFI